MINRSDLLKNLQGLLPHIEKDILAYSKSNQELSEHLQEQYQAALDAERIAEHFVAWREAQITQAAVAWVLTCVFVRFLEDNDLLTEPVLSGPVSNKMGDNALQQAKERMVAYFNENPTHEDRHYLLNLFDELQQYPVIRELLDHKHNPLWQIPVSADGAKLLIDFFHKIDPETGDIQHDFTDPEWDTRFLGDLYQDLSESVRKRYALLQTPEFVESFILDYTLEPAIDAFGLPGLRLIDPTVGSGHFLLTTFERVFNRWVKREPGTNTRELAQRALDVVHGVDINPYAISICRFRLLIAAMQACGSQKIKSAPNFNFNLACGDSLLYGSRFEWLGQGIQNDFLEEKNKHVYEVEDPKKLGKILGQRYHVVVGNPPYITVKDKALNQAYRDKYTTCHRKYSLGVPFTERFFDLTLAPEGNQSAGFMGMITTNSFMKREFGKKLIEDYLPSKDVTHVIDTSGAYIPGHGTPTVILFARNQSYKSEVVRVVQGIRGEPGTPQDAGKGKVWTSIVHMAKSPGTENEFISVVDQERDSLGKHPWSIGGGGASELKLALEKGSYPLSSVIGVIGFGAILGEDEAFGIPANKLLACQLPIPNRPLIEGEQVRDWSLDSATTVLFPYNEEISLNISVGHKKYLWPLRALLWSRNTFGNQTYKDAGRHYAEYHQIPIDRNKTPLSITFAFVSTHNHFSIDRGGKVFNRTAPVIKLPFSATEAEHLALLGLLNSSMACFWGRQTFFGRGGFSDGKWQERLEWDGTKLKFFPVISDPIQKVQSIAEQIEHLSQVLFQAEPAMAFKNMQSDLAAQLEAVRLVEYETVGKMIALQEELDWYVYNLYGLTDEILCYEQPLPAIELGQRAFEISLARSIEQGESETIWFEHHGSTPITEIPGHWPADYQELVQKRLEIIESNPSIKLIDNMDHKRRWSRESWDVRLKAAAQEWLLDQCEQAAQGPELQTCAQLADRLRRNTNVMRVAEIYSGTTMVDLQPLIVKLIDSDNVPQMAAARLRPIAMPKLHAWQETWDKQRLEDAIDAKHGVDQPLAEDAVDDIEKVAAYEHAKQQAAIEKQQTVGDIPVPPQYKQTDFRKPIYWKLRGKLDVPKERFFSLPGGEKDGDSTLVIGWAGLDHLQRAQAIASWYLERKENEGLSHERLLPMLVALDELIPWLKQWHNEIDPEFGERMGDYYEGFLLEELRHLQVPLSELPNWQPSAAVKKPTKRQKKAAE